jgi:probable rRNA maturation factor
MPSFNINTKYIDTILELVSNKVLKTQKGTLNIVFLDQESIKNLNKEYREIDKTTDVLSFHYFDNFDELNNEDIA